PGSPGDCRRGAELPPRHLRCDWKLPRLFRKHGLHAPAFRAHCGRDCRHGRTSRCTMEPRCMSDAPYLSLVLPCRNQADHIRDVLLQYAAPLEAYGCTYELIVV